MRTILSYHTLEWGVVVRKHGVTWVLLANYPIIGIADIPCRSGLTSWYHIVLRILYIQWSLRLTARYISQLKDHNNWFITKHYGGPRNPPKCSTRNRHKVSGLRWAGKKTTNFWADPNTSPSLHQERKRPRTPQARHRATQQSFSTGSTKNR